MIFFILVDFSDVESGSWVPEVEYGKDLCTVKVGTKYYYYLIEVNEMKQNKRLKNIHFRWKLLKF